MTPKIDWHIIEATEAVFKSFEDDGRELSVYIHSQPQPIVCTSGHRDKCLKALAIVKQLNDGDQIKYYTKGANTPGWKEKYFYSLERMMSDDEIRALMVDIAVEPKDSADQFKVGKVINHTAWGRGEIKEVIERGEVTQLKVWFYTLGKESLMPLNTLTMTVADEIEDF